MPVGNLLNALGWLLKGARAVVLGARNRERADAASPQPALAARPTCPLPADADVEPERRVSVDDVPDEDRISACMTKPVVTLDAEKTAAHAQALMAKHNISSVLVRTGRSMDKGRAGACQGEERARRGKRGWRAAMGGAQLMRAGQKGRERRGCACGNLS